MSIGHPDDQPPPQCGGNRSKLRSRTGCRPKGAAKSAELRERPVEGEIAVVCPDPPPQLNHRAAQVFLRILLHHSESGDEGI